MKCVHRVARGGLLVAALKACVAIGLIAFLAAPAAMQVQAQQAPGGSFSVRPSPDQDAERPRNPARELGPSSGSWFTFRGEQGAVIQDSVQIVNTGSVPVTLLVYGVDAATGPTSGMVFQGAEAPRHGVGAWITVGTPEVRLSPGETRDISFSVAVPAGARVGESWGGIVVQDTHVRQGTGRFAVNQVVRAAVAVGVILAGPREERLSIRSVSAKVVNDLHQAFVVEVAHEGNVLLKPRGTFELRDARGTLVGQHELALDSVLAGSTLPYEFFWPQAPLPAGTYHVEVALRASPEAPAARFSDASLQVSAPTSRLAPAEVPEPVSLRAITAAAGGSGWALAGAAAGGAGALALVAAAGHALLPLVRSRRARGR